MSQSDHRRTATVKQGRTQDSSTLGSPLSKKPQRLLLANWEGNEEGLFQRQYTLLIVFLALVLVIYVGRLWYLQVLHGANYRYQSEHNRIRFEEIPAPRGLIFDRYGVPLVENRPAYHLMLIREDIFDMDETLQRIAELTGKPVDELRKTVEAQRNQAKFVPIRLLSDIDRDCLARLEAWRLRLPGVFIRVEPKREYKWNKTAAHLIGYLSEISEKELRQKRYHGYSSGEDVGKIGVEKIFESYLHGKSGWRQVEVNAVGRRIRLLSETLPIPGRNIWLTIDAGLQREVESYLQGHIGAIVVVDPNQGSILAMASSPTFDQEMFVRGLDVDDWRKICTDPSHPLLNRAINATYPPGSTYKPIIALAALQEGVIRVNTKIFCPGFYRLGRRRYRCWKEVGHGWMNPHEAIVQSCDVFFYQVGLKLGVDRIAKYARMFGLGQRTHLGLYPEQPGLVPTSAWKKRTKGIAWQKGETLSVAIGQGFDLVTPLQMALVYAAIANGGTLWQPYLISRIEGSRPEELKEFGRKVRRKIPIAAKYFKFVQSGLKGVVAESHGTAKRIRLADIAIAGKTGTAQVVRMPENISRRRLAQITKDHEKDHAWFVGYAPANHPKIVVSVLIEHGGHGSSAAAPLAQKVIKAYFQRQMSGTLDTEPPGNRSGGAG